MGNISNIAGVAIAGAALIASVMPAESQACSRIVYRGEDSLNIVARSLDWKTPIPTNIYVYPAGMKKRGSPDPGALEWTSRYGAVYAVGYDGGVTEGMNEKGLVINGLFCKGTVYDSADSRGKPPVSLSVFVAWLLDMNATTDDVVRVLENHDFSIYGVTFDGGTASTLHWGITDASGKTALLEFDNGAVRIYDPGDVRAMTNDPQWPQMKAIVEYWDKIGGTHALPGTVSSPDRCVRANFFAHHVKSVADTDLGVSIARSLLVNVSVPYTYLIEGEPNVSSTQWRSYSVTCDLRYYFDIVTNPGMFYVDLNRCDLRPGARVMKLDTSDSAGLVGDITSRLKKSEPFNPMF